MDADFLRGEGFDLLEDQPQVSDGAAQNGDHPVAVGSAALDVGVDEEVAVVLQVADLRTGQQGVAPPVQAGLAGIGVEGVAALAAPDGEAQELRIVVVLAAVGARPAQADLFVIGLGPQVLRRRRHHLDGNYPDGRQAVGRAEEVILGPEDDKVRLVRDVGAVGGPAEGFRFRVGLPGTVHRRESGRAVGQVEGAAGGGQQDALVRIGQGGGGHHVEVDDLPGHHADLLVGNHQFRRIVGALLDVDLHVADQRIQRLAVTVGNYEEGQVVFPRNLGRHPGDLARSFVDGNAGITRARQLVLGNEDPWCALGDGEGESQAVAVHVEGAGVMRPDGADAGLVDRRLGEGRRVVTAVDQRPREVVDRIDAEGDLYGVAALDVTHVGHPVLVAEADEVAAEGGEDVAHRVLVALDPVAQGQDKAAGHRVDLPVAPADLQGVAVHVGLARFRVGDDGGAGRQLAGGGLTVAGVADDDLPGPVVGRVGQQGAEGKQKKNQVTHRPGEVRSAKERQRRAAFRSLNA